MLLPAEFVRADESCNVTDSAFKEAANAINKDTDWTARPGDQPNSIGGVRFVEVHALREVECFIKEVLNSRRLSGAVRKKGE